MSKFKFKMKFEMKLKCKRKTTKPKLRGEPKLSKFKAKGDCETTGMSTFRLNGSSLKCKREIKMRASKRQETTASRQTSAS